MFIFKGLRHILLSVSLQAEIWSCWFSISVLFLGIDTVWHFEIRELFLIVIFKILVQWNHMCRPLLTLYSVLTSAGTRGRRLSSVVASQHIFSGSIRVFAFSINQFSSCVKLICCSHQQYSNRLRAFSANTVLSKKRDALTAALICHHIMPRHGCAQIWPPESVAALFVDLLAWLVVLCLVFSSTLLQVLTPRTVRITRWFMHILEEMAR